MIEFYIVMKEIIFQDSGVKIKMIIYQNKKVPNLILSYLLKDPRLILAIKVVMLGIYK